MYNKLLICLAVLIGACNQQSEKIKSTNLLPNNDISSKSNISSTPDNIKKSEDTKLATRHVVNFDYSKYSREREIALKYIKSSIANKDDPISADNLGIDLYDIDNDGQNEILVYLDNNSYCGSAGCRFYILKNIKNNSAKLNESIYKFISWSDNTTINHDAVYTGDNIKLLQSKTNNVYDILLPQPQNDTIWKWKNGGYTKQ